MVIKTGYLQTNRAENKLDGAKKKIKLSISSHLSANLPGPVTECATCSNVHRYFQNSIRAEVANAEQASCTISQWWHDK